MILAYPDILAQLYIVLSMVYGSLLPAKLHLNDSGRVSPCRRSDVLDDIVPTKVSSGQ